MTNHFEQLMRQALETKLSGEEKNTIRTRIMSQLSLTKQRHSYRWFAPAFAFGLLVLLVLPMQAEQALPGDFLYSVKEKVNEPVRNLTAINEEQDVEIDINRMERQYRDLELLAKEAGI